MMVTLKDYLRGYKSLYGVVAAIPFLPPTLQWLAHAVALDSQPIIGYLYPPLGGMQQLAFVSTFAFFLMTPLLVYVCCREFKNIRVTAKLSLFIAAIIIFCLFMFMQERYVVRVAISSIDTEVTVSVGYQRSQFAIEAFENKNKNVTDWEMLNDLGPWEKNIQKLWTPHSVATVRLLLWLSFTLSPMCLIAFAGISVYQHVQDDLKSIAEPNTPA